MGLAFEERFAKRMGRIGSSVIREILKLTRQPGYISFAGGLPAPEIFPVAEVREACDTVLREQGGTSLQYSPTEGYLPLRQWLAERTDVPGITAENVLIVSGSQQALDFIGKLFLDPGDTVAVEAPTYLGALQAWNVYEARYDGVACDEEGMQLGALEPVLARNPKFLYALPNFQNPTGITMSTERREGVVALAKQYDVPILEDDAYGDLHFEGKTLPSLLSMHPEGVIRVGTLSKILVPGLRVAWVVAPTDVISRLVQIKQAADLHTPTFNQAVTYELLKGDLLERHIARIRTEYRARRDVMLEAIRKHFPPEVHYTVPEGGMFLWVTLPEGMDATELLKETIKGKVAYVPGAAFYADGSGKNTMRLNYTNTNNEGLEQGINVLANVIKEQMQVLA